MRPYLFHKLLAAVGVALFLGAQMTMGFLRIRDIFPLFTWSLYSHANVDLVMVPTIDIIAIDGQKQSSDVLSAYRGTVAFAQKRKLAEAVGRNDHYRAREVLRGLLQAANVPYKNEVELNVHFNQVRLTDYLRKGEVVSRQSLPTKVERL